MLPKFLLFREVRLRLERVRITMLTRSQRGPPYFSSRSPMQDVVIHYAETLKAATEPLKTSLGKSPQLNRRLPTQPRSFTTIEYGFEVTSSV